MTHVDPRAGSGRLATKKKDLRPTTRAAAPSRNARGTLTREAIVAAARKIGERDGFEALSMPSLAAELGVGTMSAYRHVKNKSELVALVVDSLLAEVVVPDPSTGAWDERLIQLSRNRFASLRRVRGIGPALVGLRPGEHHLRLVDAQYTLLLEGGFKGVEAVEAFAAILNYTVGCLCSDTVAPSGPVRDPRAKNFASLREVAPFSTKVNREAAMDLGLRALMHGLREDVSRRNGSRSTRNGSSPRNGRSSPGRK